MILLYFHTDFKRVISEKDITFVDSLQKQTFLLKFRSDLKATRGFRCLSEAEYRHSLLHPTTNLYELRCSQKRRSVLNIVQIHNLSI